MVAGDEKKVNPFVLRFGGDLRINQNKIVKSRTLKLISFLALLIST
jgi:hypothetical protein